MYNDGPTRGQFNDFNELVTNGMGSDCLSRLNHDGFFRSVPLEEKRRRVFSSNVLCFIQHHKQFLKNHWNDPPKTKSGLSKEDREASH